MTTAQLIRQAESASDAHAKSAMKKLREIDPTYHYCPEWDYMVICKDNIEFQACMCDEYQKMKKK